MPHRIRKLTSSLRQHDNTDTTTHLPSYCASLNCVGVRPVWRLNMREKWAGVQSRGDKEPDADIPPFKSEAAPRLVLVICTLGIILSGLCSGLYALIHHTVGL